MNLVKRKAREKRRKKTMTLRRNVNIPCHASKFGYRSDWNGQGLTAGEVQSVRKTTRRLSSDDQNAEPAAI